MGKEFAHKRGWNRLDSLDCLVKNRMEFKTVETRAFFTVCEVLQVLAHGWVVAMRLDFCWAPFMDRVCD